MSKILIIHNLEDRDALQSRMSVLLEKPEKELILVKLKKGFSNQIPKDVNEIVLAGGNHIKVSGQPSLKEEIFQFVQNCELPLIGICFGAQLIARAFGAGIVQLPRPRSEISNIRIIRDKQLFGNKYVQSVYNRHAWSLQNLPDEFIIYACSATGIEMFRHRTRKIGAVQFHPELFMGTCQGAKLFQQLRHLIISQHA